jgi:endoglycosylceramidase
LQLTPVGSELHDALGRTVYLRGVDSGGQSKAPPYFPFAFAESGVDGEASAPPFTQAAMDYVHMVAERGFTIVRLLFLWEALEPTQGTYDDEYLGRVATFASDFGSVGIRVILDNHQDCYAHVFCGEGFPQWTLDGYSAQAPSSCNPWYQGYLGEIPDMSAAYDRLYANTGGVEDAFVAMWQHVAQQMAPIDNIVAFEILNEPYQGTMDQTTWAAGPLKSFYETVATALRQEAPGKLLVFEPSGTTPGQGGVIAVPPDGTDWIFGPHYYEPQAFVFGPDVTTAWMNMTNLVTPIAQLGPKWSLPVFLGEFGVSNQYMNTPNYLDAAWNALDALNLGGTVWHFSTTPDYMAQEQMDLWVNGQETPGFDASIRPQPSVIAGALTSFSFDRTTDRAVLALDATAGGVTELSVPTRRYPKGPSVAVSGAHIHYEYDTAAQRLRFTVPKGGTTTVTLTP